MIRANELFAPYADTPPSFDRPSPDTETVETGREAMQRHNRNATADIEDARMAAATSEARASIEARNAQRPSPVYDDRGLSPELPDDALGAAVREVLRLDRLEAARSRVASRIRDEVEALAAEAQREALVARVDESVEAAWSAAAGRKAVPPTLEPVVRWNAHTRVGGADHEVAEAVRRGVDLRATDGAREALEAALPDIDELVRESLTSALANAEQAAERLALSGVDPDVQLAAVVDSGDDAIVSSLRLWRTAVSEWGSAQAVRAWCAAGLVRGFDLAQGQLVVAQPPRIPNGPYARGELIERAEHLAGIEAQTQGSCWHGVDMPRHVERGSSHEVLRWYIKQDPRPTPRGVIDGAETTSEAAR